MIKKYKHFPYASTYMSVIPGSHILYEYTLPSVVMSEEGLSRLAEKKEFQIMTQIREGSARPVVRIMRKVTPFINFEESDTFLKSINKSLKSNGINFDLHKAIILPSKFDFVFYTDWYRGGRHLTITTKFERKEDQPLTLEEIIPSLRYPNNIYQHVVMLYRDKVDEDNVWNIKFAANSNAGSRIETPANEFVANVTALLNPKTPFQYRVTL